MASRAILNQICRAIIVLGIPFLSVRFTKIHENSEHFQEAHYFCGPQECFPLAHPLTSKVTVVG